MTLKKVVDFDPAKLECPRCGHVEYRTSYADGKGTKNLQRCKGCGHVAVWTTFERVDTPE